MAVFAKVAVPIIPSPKRSGFANRDRSIWPKPRIYDDGPLPTKPANKADHDAKITGRYCDSRGAFYQLDVGGVEIGDVRIEEILDYVSPLTLEKFETQQFEEEGALLKIAEDEEAREAAERIERKQMKKKMKGLSLSDSDASSSEDDLESPPGEPQPGQETAIAQGKHGRARPTYSHLFKLADLKSKTPSFVTKGRRRRKRDPITNILMPLSDDDDDDDDGQNRGRSIGTSSAHHGEVGKRRRRKRDPVTGELMPLSDHGSDGDGDNGRNSRHLSATASSGTRGELEKRRRRKRDPITGMLMPLSPRGSSSDHFIQEKRTRRRRHPVTGELMPLGWKYDPDEEKQQRTSTKRGQAAVMDVVSPKMNRLNISGMEPVAKRVKLEISESSSSAEEGVSRTNPISLPSESESESESERSVVSVKAMPKLFTPRGMLANQQRPMYDGAWSSPEASPEPPKNTKTPVKKEPVRNTITSILHSSPGRDESEDLDEDLDDDEWYIEAIVAHRPEFGDAASRLYQVKWEGSDELTWEPIDSFPDREIIEDYEMRVGLLPPKGSSQKRKSVLVRRTMPSLPVTQSQSNLEDSTSDDDGWEVEGILAHHMSDPRTHAYEHGKKPIMLYQVKWVGFEETTWEPFSSFPDRAVVDKYRRKVGLLPIPVPK